MNENGYKEQAPMTTERIMEIDKARGLEDLDEYVSRLVATVGSRYAFFDGGFGGQYVHFHIPQGASEEWIREVYAQYKKLNKRVQG